jgi:hypothetical protein
VVVVVGTNQLSVVTHLNGSVLRKRSVCDTSNDSIKSRPNAGEMTRSRANQFAASPPDTEHKSSIKVAASLTLHSPNDIVGGVLALAAAATAAVVVVAIGAAVPSDSGLLAGAGGLESSVADSVGAVATVSAVAVEVAVEVGGSGSRAL